MMIWRDSINPRINKGITLGELWECGSNEYV